MNIVLDLVNKIPTIKSLETKLSKVMFYRFLTIALLV